MRLCCSFGACVYLVFCPLVLLSLDALAANINCTSAKQDQYRQLFCYSGLSRLKKHHGVFDLLGYLKHIKLSVIVPYLFHFGVHPSQNWKQYMPRVLQDRVSVWY